MALDHFYLVEAGYLYGSKTKCSFLLDNSPQHKVTKLFKMEFSERAKILTYAAFDEFGKEEFKASTAPLVAGSDARFIITAASQQIGEIQKKNISFRKHTDLQTFGELHNIKMQGWIKNFGTHFWYELKNTVGNKVCSMHNRWKGVVDIQMDDNLKERAKILLLCAGVLFSHTALKHHWCLPQVNISNLQKNDQNKLLDSEYQLKSSALKNISHAKNIIVKSAGHNSLKNRVYYNVYDNPFSKVYATIEVTPISNYQGYAQLEIKNDVGKTLCTAVHFQQQEITAIYNEFNGLICYRRNKIVYDTHHRPLLELTKLKPRPSSTQPAGYHMFGYVNVATNYTIAKHSIRRSGISNIYNYLAQHNKTLSDFDPICILIFAMDQIITSMPIEQPTPEIEYYYYDSLPATRSYISKFIE